MSDDAPDAGGRLWARPEAPDLSPDGRRREPWPGTEPVTPAEPVAVPGHPAPPLFAWWAGFAAILAGYAMAIVAVGIAAVASGSTDGPGITIGGTYLQDAALFAAAFLFARVGGGAGGLAALGWRRVPAVGQAAMAAAGVLVAFYVIGAIYGNLVGIQNASDETVDALGLKTGNARLILSAILLTLVAPLVEETLFRGLLFGALWRWKGWVFGAVVSGVVFGGIHVGGAPAEALPVLALLGFGLAFLYWYTGSLLPGIGVHSFNNAVTLAVTVDWATGPRLLLVVGAPALAVGIAWACTSRLSVPARA